MWSRQQVCSVMVVVATAFSATAAAFSAGSHIVPFTARRGGVSIVYGGQQQHRNLPPLRQLFPLKRPPLITQLLAAPRRRRTTDNEFCNGKDDSQKEGIPCLPPIGASSYDDNTESFSSSSPIKESAERTNVAFVVADKFELQYTCKVCETRNSHKVSRVAYRQGVVIAVCKGCRSKHLIADNLGWHKYIGGFDGKETNIEEFLIGRGEDVSRVSKDVFELEKVLGIIPPSEPIYGFGPSGNNNNNELQ